ncbi:MAG TPA: hypothetical protein VM689_07760 [Aliidongia sp.]|nr:hypothetical protein [Aliidongia sp.]
MPLGRVLLPVDGTRLLEAKLDWALALAPRFAPTIDVAFQYGTVDPITVERNPMIGDPGWLTSEDAWVSRADSLQSVRAKLGEWAERRQVSYMGRRGNGPATVRLLEMTADYAAAVEEHGRLSDLIVVGQPGPGATALEIEINRLSLMTTGRRMVVIPPDCVAPADIFEHVLLAWEGGPQATRMIALMMDILVASAKVTIFTAGEARNVARKQELMRDYLRCNGVDAAFILDEHLSSRVGPRVLKQIERNSATLVGMGAYEHLRMIELVIGGNTRHLYGRSKVPLILVF